MTTERRIKQLENISDRKDSQVAVAEARLERAIAEVETARRLLQKRQAEQAEAISNLYAAL